MKQYFMLLALMALASCSNNSTPASNNNSNSNSGIFGINYMPLLGNSDWTEHAAGTVTHLDTNGNVTGTDEVERDYNAGILDSAIFLPYQSNNSAKVATILPKVLTVGLSWMPSPEALPIVCNAKFVQQLSQYTNNGGTAYTDVIQINVSYLDSTSQMPYYMNKHAANVNLYFANGVGLVEADILSWEYQNWLIEGGITYDFCHQTAKGSLYRKN